MRNASQETVATVLKGCLDFSLSTIPPTGANRGQLYQEHHGEDFSTHHLQ
ncbi:hypothetical protein SUZIE_117165 [Sciurus carolinensis]|uniref:Uncharacterized protein n=1 Tax=Sciurus carolinensis TaxID=30640 RepID=A0AA41MHX8_SCICA|nr:hypothetical protein [Sciurus carolinensis]